jgi:predicted RNA-binding Zn-ribbon protein involved in translation (DUF1610 family)
MKKFECPHCGEKTITPLKKAFAGTQKSKGVICPSCGMHCTNGNKSTIFHNIVDLIMLVIVIILYFKMPPGDNFYYMAAVMLTTYVFNRIVDALFFPMAPSLRLDL